MTPSLTDQEMVILALALQACDDPDAREVLHDAIEESGWRASIPYPEQATPAGRWLALHSWWVDDGDRPLNRDHCRAIAAVLLFRDWSTEMWPVAACAELGHLRGCNLPREHDGPCGIVSEFATSPPGYWVRLTL